MRSDRSVFEQIKAGLEDSIAHSKGRITLATTVLPAPPPRAGPRDVARLRRRLNMSQGVFAAVLNVSVRTVQSWEQGVREPSDVALRMLQILRQRPEIVTSELFTNGRRPPRRSLRRRPAAKSRRT